MRDDYDENYYERGIELGISGYSNYMWLPEMTIPMCHHLVHHLQIDEHSRILDFGCAKGYVVQALKLLGYDAYGIDISEYAIGQASRAVAQRLACVTEPQNVIDVMFSFTAGKGFTHIIAKDVLEHVPYAQIDQWLKALRSLLVPPGKLYVLVPLADMGKYRIPAYEQDVTHKIRENETWWRIALEAADFTPDVFVHKLRGIKENWSAYETGNLQCICRITSSG
jgi:2-polyprenyl-3-methyl-5-hydroxy-6-metoxy-1,4-benzoquinol methylase